MPILAITKLLLNRWNETDVREEVISPLLREFLSYKAEHITRELTLRYPYRILGRKKPEKDPPLQVGRADYLLDVDGRLRVVIDAKKPGPISDDDREQTYSYAMHPEVRAIYFCLFSGSHFEVFHTLHNPESGPVLAFTYEQFGENLKKLKQLIGVEELIRDNPRFVIDVSDPLAPGLRSFAKITFGRLQPLSLPEHISHYMDLRTYISIGSLERSTKPPGIYAYLRPAHPTGSIERFATKLKIRDLHFFSTAQEISTDKYRPTIFTSEQLLDIDAGVEIPHFPAFEHSAVTEIPIKTTATAIVQCYIEGNIVRGIVTAYAPGVPDPVIQEIELHLS